VPGADPGLAAEPFPGARLLGHTHAQTIWPALFRRDRPRAGTVERWPMPDGHGLFVDLLPERRGVPGVLVLHGLEGSSRARYVRGLLASIEERGWNGAAVSFRSCEPAEVVREADGGGPGEPSVLEDRPLDARFYHSGDTRDLPVLLERLRTRWGGAPLGAVGFSLGANVLLKWLGEVGEAAPLDGAVAVSPPFDLAACAAAVDGPGLFATIYRRRFLRTLRRKALGVAIRHPERFDAGAIRVCPTFRRYDDLVTAPLFGFTGAADYWARCSSVGFLPAIRRPTLLVCAEDDPIVPGWCIPRAAIAANPALRARIFTGGGHVGFMTGAPWRPRFLVDQLALEFLGGSLTGSRRSG
jgi:predicted alpha/beta-fold hydrolase